MKVLVPVKRVVDANVKVRVKPDNTGVDLANVKMAVNPFCEIAIEEAVRLREAGTATEVVAVAVGATACQEQLRTCLALGADRAVLIETDANVQPLGIAKALKALQDKEQADIVIFGKQSIDGDNSQTGQMFAALAGMPQATFASEITVADGKLEVIREVDGGLQTVSVTLPAVVTTGQGRTLDRLAARSLQPRRDRWLVSLSRREQPSLIGFDHRSFVQEPALEPLR